jgi:leader peptidase (prepilin peptidase)/N-methyltransferase
MPEQVLALYAHSPGAYAVAFVLGALFGSFANVCIVRWPPTDEHPRGRSVVQPGSHCPACGHDIRWYDNVPLLSYLWLRGRCRDCGASFSPRYLLVEAVVAALFVVSYHFCVAVAFPFEPLSVRMLWFVTLAALSFVLVVITFIDIDHMLILNKVTLPSIAAFYALGLWLPGRTWATGLIGAAVGYGVIWLVANVYLLLTGRDGMGYGDGKLLAIIGALMGWPAVVFALFIGSLVGSVVGIPVALVMRRRDRGEVESEQAAEGAAGEAARAATDEAAAEAAAEAEAEPSLRHMPLPFGPFLAVGALAYVFIHPWIRIELAGF